MRRKTLARNWFDCFTGIDQDPGVQSIYSQHILKSYLADGKKLKL